MSGNAHFRDLNSSTLFRVTLACLILVPTIAATARDLPLHSINTGDNQQQPFHQLLASEAAASQHLNLPDVATAATQAHPQEGINAAGGQQKSAAAAKAAFLRQYGHHYGYKGWLDKHWQQEVGYRFGQHLQHYLDFTGAALYTRSHVRAASRLLEHTTLSNPHSRNPSSLAAERELRVARQLVLQFFNADPDEYAVVWTSGATAGMKLVGESFPWTSPPSWSAQQQVPPGGISDTEVGLATPCGHVLPEADAAVPTSSNFVYLQSNHKSVLGIGAYAKARGVPLSCVDEAGMAAWLQSPSTQDPAQHASARYGHHSTAPAAGTATAAPAPAPATATAAAAAARPSHHSGAAAAAAAADTAADTAAAGNGMTFSLVAYPSKDNYEGRLFPLEWVEKTHAKSTPTHRWLVVLDAAAHVPTHPLDLSKVHPDFVPVSWYKVFGFPSGLGALVARKESLMLLHKVYFGGGSVVEATAEDVWRVLMPPPDGYEDGTQSFLSISQLQFGFEQLHKLGGVQAVELHVQSLQLWLAEALTELYQSNGQPLIKLFGQHHRRDVSVQSCIFQMLVLRPDGSVVSSSSVEQRAAAQGFGIREGCMCNPSQCNLDLGITPEEKRASILNNTDTGSGFLTVWRVDTEHTGQLRPVQLPVGSVRVSLGYLSTFEDVYAFVQFLKRNYLDTDPAVAAATA